MKKFLVILMILAVAGGVFAQVTFTGSVQTGLALGFTNATKDAGAMSTSSNGTRSLHDNAAGYEPLIGYVRNRGEQGIRADLNVAFVSEDKTYGANLTLRGRENIFGGPTENGTNLTTYVPTASVYWQPIPQVWVQVGTGGGAGWGTMGGIDASLDLLDNNGLKLKVTPMTGLEIAFQAFYGAPTNGQFQKLFAETDLGFGVRYTVPNMLIILGNLRFNRAPASFRTPVVDELGMTQTALDAYLANAGIRRDNEINFGIGANYIGLKGVGLTKIAVDFGGRRFGSKYSYIGVGESVNFEAMGGNLKAGVRAQQWLWMGTGSSSFIPMLFHGNVSYTMGKIVPGIEARYLIGGHPNFNWRDAGEIGGVDGLLTTITTNDDGTLTYAYGFQKNAAAFGISPSVKFNVGPTITVGYNLQMDLSTGNQKVGYGLDKRTAKTLQHLIYVGLDVAF